MKNCVLFILLLGSSMQGIAQSPNIAARIAPGSCKTFVGPDGKQHQYCQSEREQQPPPPTQVIAGAFNGAPPSSPPPSAYQQMPPPIQAPPQPNPNLACYIPSGDQNVAACPAYALGACSCVDMYSNIYYGTAGPAPQ